MATKLGKGIGENGLDDEQHVDPLDSLFDCCDCVGNSFWPLSCESCGIMGSSDFLELAPGCFLCFSPDIFVVFS